jgi:hypothetical protein
MKRAIVRTGWGAVNPNRPCQPEPLGSTRQQGDQALPAHGAGMPNR